MADPQDKVQPSETNEDQYLVYPPKLQPGETLENIDQNQQLKLQPGETVVPADQVSSSEQTTDTKSQSFGDKFKEEVTPETVASGFGKDFAGGLIGAANIAHKIPFVGHALEGASGAVGDLLGLPRYGADVDPYKTVTEAVDTTPRNLGEKAGYWGGSLTEFLMGDAALEGLTYSGKLEAASKIAKVLETSPRLVELLNHGAKLQQLIRDYPTLANLLKTSIRAGATQTAQTTVHTGGDVKAGIEQGLETAGATAALSAPFAAIGKLGEMGQKAAKVTENMGSVAKLAPEEADLAGHLKQRLDTVSNDLHTGYETGVQDLSKRMHGQTVEESPLSDTASEILKEFKDESSATHPLVAKTKEAVGAGLRPDVKQLIQDIARVPEQSTVSSTSGVTTGDVSRFAVPEKPVEGDVDFATRVRDALHSDDEQLHALGSEVANLENKYENAADITEKMKALEKLRDAQDRLLKAQGIETPAVNKTTAEQSENFKTRNKERVEGFKNPENPDIADREVPMTAADKDKLSVYAGESENIKRQMQAIESTASGHGSEGGSLEEIARGEKFIRVGPNGIKEYQGLSPDPSSALKKNEAIVAVKPDGTWRVQDGNLDTAKDQIKNVQDLLKNNPQTKAQRPLSVDDLITLRQQVRQLSRSFDYGDINSRTLRRLLPSIDDTIEKMANKAGDTKLADDYAALRSNYKEKINALDAPAIEKIREGKVNQAADQFLSAKGQSRYNLNRLETLLGDRGMDSFRKEVYSRMVANATNEGGRFDPAKFMKSWNKLNPEIRSNFFDLNNVKNGLDALTKDAKSAASFQRLVRYGVLPAPLAGAGIALHHPLIVLLGGLADAGRITEASKILDNLSNNPKIWSTVIGLGKVGKFAQAVKAPQVVSKEATDMANDKRNIYQGARGPLGSIVKQNDVYTNQ